VDTEEGTVLIIQADCKDWDWTEEGADLVPSPRKEFEVIQTALLRPMTSRKSRSNVIFQQHLS
jgi:hypothetical protein